MRKIRIDRVDWRRPRAFFPALLVSASVGLSVYALLPATVSKQSKVAGGALTSLSGAPSTAEPKPSPQAAPFQTGQRLPNAAATAARSDREVMVRLGFVRSLSDDETVASPATTAMSHPTSPGAAPVTVAAHRPDASPVSGPVIGAANPTPSTATPTTPAPTLPVATRATPAKPIELAARTEVAAAMVPAPSIAKPQSSVTQLRPSVGVAAVADAAPEKLAARPPVEPGLVQRSDVSEAASALAARMSDPGATTSQLVAASAMTEPSYLGRGGAIAPGSTAAIDHTNSLTAAASVPTSEPSGRGNVASPPIEIALERRRGGVKATMPIDLDIASTRNDRVLIGKVPAGVTFTKGQSTGFGTWQMRVTEFRDSQIVVGSGAPDTFELTLLLLDNGGMVVNGVEVAFRQIGSPQPSIDVPAAARAAGATPPKRQPAKTGAATDDGRRQTRQARKLPAVAAPAGASAPAIGPVAAAPSAFLGFKPWAPEGPAAPAGLGRPQ